MRLPLALLAASVLAGGVSADIITLKNGRVIEGDVIKDDGTTVKVKLKYGALTLERSEIASIEEKPTPEQEYETRVAALDATDAKAQLELAEWAASKKLEDEAVKHFIEAWKLDPDLARAKAGLEERDWHLSGGEWQDRDTYYKGLGWVRYEGRWIHPLEYSWRLSMQILDKYEQKLAVAKARLSSARAERRRAEAVADAAERTLEGIPARIENAEARLAQFQADARIADRELEASERAVDRWQLIYDQEKLKADRAEVNSLGTADLELRRAQRRRAVAEMNVRSLDDSIAREQKEIAALEAAEKSTGRELEKARAGVADLDDRLAGLVKDVAALEDDVAQQEAEVKAASEAWEKAK